MAKALAGNALTFTRGAFGNALVDGERPVPTDEEMDNLTALIHERLSLDIINFEVKDGQLIATLHASNATVNTSFRIAEGGLFAKDPETDEEVLYCYFWDGDDGERMPAKDSAVQLEYEYDIITAVSNAPNVSCVVKRIYQGLSQEELDAHINSSAPHPNWSVVSAATFNNHVSATNPHPQHRRKA